MKKSQCSAAIGLVVFLFISFLPITTLAQDAKVTQDITQAMQKADASQLAKHFNPSIDLSLPGHEDTFSKKQAEQIVKAFFSKYPVKSYTLAHSGNSNNGSRYIIGSYISTTQKTFRIYLLIKKNNGVDLIQQLQIEQE